MCFEIINVIYYFNLLLETVLSFLSALSLTVVGSPLPAAFVYGQLLSLCSHCRADGR